MVHSSRLDRLDMTKRLIMVLYRHKEMEKVCRTLLTDVCCEEREREKCDRGVLQLPGLLQYLWDDGQAEVRERTFYFSVSPWRRQKFFSLYSLFMSVDLYNIFLV
jgi:hypothetical protein